MNEPHDAKTEKIDGLLCVRACEENKQYTHKIICILTKIRSGGLDQDKLQRCDWVSANVGDCIGMFDLEWLRTFRVAMCYVEN